jgi:hypothetical protein
MLEESMQRLHDNGFTNILILDTGRDSRFGRYEGPSQYHVRSRAVISYDKGQQVTHELTYRDDSYDVVLFTDTDLFFSGCAELQEQLEEFEKSNYGYVGHLIAPELAEEFTTRESFFTEVPEIKLNTDVDPPVPYPHWENAYSLVRADVWQDLTREEVGHHRRFMAGIKRLGVKVGARGKIDYRWRCTSWGKEWFHIATLITSYYALETGELAKRFRPGEFYQFRVGYFLFQRERYGSDIYSNQVNERIDDAVELVGGRHAIDTVWQEVCRGTCLEDW